MGGVFFLLAWFSCPCALLVVWCRVEWRGERRSRRGQRRQRHTLGTTRAVVGRRSLWLDCVRAACVVVGVVGCGVCVRGLCCAVCPFPTPPFPSRTGHTHVRLNGLPHFFHATQRDAVSTAPHPGPSHPHQHETKRDQRVVAAAFGSQGQSPFPKHLLSPPLLLGPCPTTYAIARSIHPPRRRTRLLPMDVWLRYSLGASLFHTIPLTPSLSSHVHNPTGVCVGGTAPRSGKKEVGGDAHRHTHTHTHKALLQGSRLTMGKCDACIHTSKAALSSPLTHPSHPAPLLHVLGPRQAGGLLLSFLVAASTPSPSTSNLHRNPPTHLPGSTQSVHPVKP